MKKINELFFLRPWAIKEDILNVMIEIVERHLKGEKLSQEEIQARVGADKKESPAYEVINGIAHIPVYGIIAKRISMINGISQPQGTSIEEIQRDFLSALNDDSIEKILLEIDSPGGSVDGVDELSELIFESRGKKPIIAYANGMMASAAYYIGSAADKLYASKSAEVGSIGVYAVIRDMSVMEHNLGIKTEIIKAGRYKAAGHPSKPMTEEDKAVIQSEVNHYFELFTEAIRRNRNMSVDGIEKVANGKVFIGKKAVELGLVDGIERFDTLLKTPIKTASRKSNATADIDNGINIEDKNHKELKPKKEEGMEITVESLKANHKAVADALIAEGKQAGLAEGREAVLKEGMKIGEESAKQAEAERIARISEAMPAKMEATAISAIKEGKTVEEAKDMYLKAFKAAAPVSAGADAEKEEGNKDLTTEEKAAKEYDLSPALRAEFISKENYVRFKKYDAAGRIKIFKK